MMFFASLQLLMPTSIVFAGIAAGFLGAHGTFPTLLEICNRILVKMAAKPFLARVVVRATWVTLGLSSFKDKVLMFL